MEGTATSSVRNHIDVNNDAPSQIQPRGLTSPRSLASSEPNLSSEFRSTPSAPLSRLPSMTLPPSLPPPLPFSPHHGYMSSGSLALSSSSKIPPVGSGIVSGNRDRLGLSITPASPHLNPSPTSGLGISTTRRLLRHRRKDPSCDACRERKVKCDATESRGCSECAMRHVRCQFTKDHNRRLSSVKQIQDLERQLQTARARIADLTHSQPSTPTGEASSYLHKFHLPSSSSSSYAPQGRQQALPTAASTAINSTLIRSLLIDLSQGLFKVPPAWRQMLEDGVSDNVYEFAPTYPRQGYEGELSDIKLPDFALTSHLCTVFREYMHPCFPLFHFASFYRTVLQLYRTPNPFHGPNAISRKWLRLFFGVLSIGAQYSSDPGVQPEGPLSSAKNNGSDYVRISMNLADHNDSSYTLEDPCTTILYTVFLVQTNMVVYANMWLSLTVRIAQELGLHRDNGPWKPFEQEMRCRAWWSIYIIDRVVSMEWGFPLCIEDSDCDISIPADVPDSLLGDESVVKAEDETSNMSSNSSALNETGQPFFLPIAWARIAPAIHKTITSSSTVPNSVLRTLESWMQDYRTKYNLYDSTKGGIGASTLPGILLMQNLRLVLHRHNLSPVTPYSERVMALRECIATARLSSSVVSKVLGNLFDVEYQSLSDEHEILTRFRRYTTVEEVTHYFRCSLFLCLAGLWLEALPLVAAARIIGERRSINQPCCRYLYGFLDFSKNRIPCSIEEDNVDEELLALVTADGQKGSGEWSTIWNPKEHPSQFAGGEAMSPASSRSSGTEDSSSAPHRYPSQIDPPYWVQNELFVRSMAKEFKVDPPRYAMATASQPSEDPKQSSSQESSPDVNICEPFKSDVSRMAISNIIAL